MKKITLKKSQSNRKIKGLLCVFVLLMTAQVTLGQTVVTWTPTATAIAAPWFETVGAGANQFQIYDVRGVGGTKGSFTWGAGFLKLDDNSLAKAGIAVFIPATSGTVTDIKVYAYTDNTRKILSGSGATVALAGAGSTITVLTKVATDFIQPWSTYANDTYYAVGGKSGGSGNSFITKIEVTFADPLAVDSFKADSSADIYSNGNQIFVSNVKSNTVVSVYSVLGTLVKTVKTSSDTSFDLASGVWIVKAKSAEGEKSVKVLIK